jgi:glycosyltransferase involved in cell wall biosynthesis
VNASYPRTPPAPEISVIVPVFNARQHLRQCLDSIIDQTWTDFELIVIDDGSTDGSCTITADLAGQDDRIQLLHQANRGYGATMNRGIDSARGRYVAIVEADDWIESTMFAELLAAAGIGQQTMTGNDQSVSQTEPILEADQPSPAPDIIKAEFYLEWPDSGRQQRYHFFSSTDLGPHRRGHGWAGGVGQTLRPRDHRGGVLLRRKPSIWSAIYRCQFLDDQQIRFNETPGAAFQDTSFNFETLALAESLIPVGWPLVHYRQDNPTSSINNPSSSNAIFTEYARIDRFLADHPALEALKHLVTPMLYDTCVWNFDRLPAEYRRSFLDQASQILRQRLSADRSIWSDFSTMPAKLTGLRMLMIDPATWAAWREIDHPELNTAIALQGKPSSPALPSSLGHRLKAGLRRVWPPSSAAFRARFDQLSRQIEVQGRLLDQLLLSQGDSQR